MKPKMIIKISMDFVMTMLLLLLMAKQLTGEAAHEWMGVGMFILWIVHHILNFKWYAHIFKRIILRDKALPRRCWILEAISKW